jgi:hypothetical protein
MADIEISSQAELRSSALVVREFLICLGWNGQGDRPFGKCSGCPQGNSDELGTPAGFAGVFWHPGEAEARYRRRARESVNHAWKTSM